MELSVFEGFMVLNCLNVLKVKANNGIKVINSLNVFNSLNSLKVSIVLRSQ